MSSYDDEIFEEDDQEEDEFYELLDEVDCEQNVYAILEMLGGLEMVEQFKRIQESEVFIINHIRMKEMRTCLNIIKRIAKGSGEEVKIVCKYNEEVKDAGAIDIEASQVLMNDVVKFSAASMLADFIDVYPLANDKVRIEFTFNNLMFPAGKAPQQ